MNYYDDDEVLTFKKKTSKKTKKKKTKEKTLEQVVKERQLKKKSEEQQKIENETKLKESEQKKIDELKKAERTAIDFELNLLGDEFDDFSKKTNTVDTVEVEQNKGVDQRVSEYDFM
jgi:hypothetical protein